MNRIRRWMLRRRRREDAIWRAVFTGDASHLTAAAEPFLAPAIDEVTAGVPFELVFDDQEER